MIDGVGCGGRSQNGLFRADVMIKNKPRRLPDIFQTYDRPLYFVTFCTRDRRPVLADEAVHEAFRDFGRQSEPRGVAIGRYVIMPDHLHLFVRLEPAKKLSQVIRLLRQRLTLALQAGGAPGPFWQPGFFDHLLRSGESYAGKWEYVRLNPERKNLVANADDWPYQGEIVRVAF